MIHHDNSNNKKIHFFVTIALYIFFGASIHLVKSQVYLKKHGIGLIHDCLSF